MSSKGGMTVASYNINNINHRLPNLIAWLKRAKPDVVCLQELKAEQSDFPGKELQRAGYDAVWRGQRSWNGVAILARDHSPILTRDRLPGDATDGQSRYIEAAISGVLIGSIYLPNGNPQPGPKFDYKLAWFERLIKYAHTLRRSRHPVVLAGDYNVVPTDFDIYPTKSWDKDALLQPECRAAFNRLVKSGWTDAIRELHPDEPMFTFWHYMRNRWARDAGLRLDHFLLSPSLAPHLIDAGVDREERGRPNASDHAPCWIRIRR